MKKDGLSWADYQTRIYRNTEDVTWMNKVHERIRGYDTFSNFPDEEETMVFISSKTNR